MNNRRLLLAGGGGCGLLGLIVVAMLCALLLVPLNWIAGLRGGIVEERQESPQEPGAVATQEAEVISQAEAQQGIATLPAAEGGDSAQQPSLFPSDLRTAQQEALLSDLYDQLNPGVVSIQTFIDSGFGSQGQGAGSGFILDQAGHIVTNNHVVAGASQIAVIFHNEFEVEATVVGTDEDSDLAVLRVEQLPDGVHPLPLADSSSVDTGQWVIAIGNPFGLGGSMSIGIVSAVGRVIPSGVTPFSIPEAIQTDAAINPGNSGGPLLNLNGEVIGVNAQIRTDPGVRANAGVGFAIPSNVVRRVVPVLIEQGAYRWPWLGVEGTGVNLLLARELNLDSQNGAYIARTVEGGPAADAGLRADDVVVELNGEPIENYNELLTLVAFSEPGEQVQLTVIRDGEPQTVNVTLGARPANFGR
jgi:2-alkenal reductase